MQISINGIKKEIPFFLSDIKLSDYTEYFKKYGELEEKGSIHDKALAWYSYWTGFDFFAKENEPFVQAAVDQYTLMHQYLTDEDDLVKYFGTEVGWRGEDWNIQDYKDCIFIDMSFNQLKIYRQLVLHMYHVNKNRWEYMPYILAVYFVKKGEKLTKDILKELADYFPKLGERGLPGEILKERMELMQNIPMNVAMAIAIMLKDIPGEYQNSK